MGKAESARAALETAKADLEAGSCEGAQLEQARNAMGSAKEARERCERNARALQIEILKVSSDADPAVDAASKAVAHASSAEDRARASVEAIRGDLEGRQSRFNSLS